MTISALGVSLSYMILFASTFFPTYCYTNLWVLLLPSIPKAFGGGLPVFQMASFSYLGDILQRNQVKPKEKLYRFLICEACLLFGGPIGLFLGGILFNTYGHRMVFLMAGIAEFIVVLYCIIRIDQKALKQGTIDEYTKLCDTKIGADSYLAGLRFTNIFSVQCISFQEILVYILDFHSL